MFLLPFIGCLSRRHLPSLPFFATILAAGTVQAAPSKPLDYTADIEPILINYCYDCHGDGASKGKVALDAHASPADRDKDISFWDRIYKNMEVHAMPPTGKDQPNPEERDKVLAWIERAVFRLDPGQPDPGRVTLRRLNRTEYNNTVRDLFGVQGLNPAERFPSDDTGYGFDTIGEVLRVSPALLEKFVEASERVMNAVIITEPPSPVTKEIPESEFRARRGSGQNGSGTLGSNGTVIARIQANEEGDYLLEVVASGSQAGGQWAIMQVDVDGGGPQAEVTVDRGPDATKAFTWPLTLKKGEARSVSLTFPNDFWDPNAPEGQRDRNLYVRAVKLKGPLNAAVPPPTAAHQRLLSLAGGATDDRQRIQAILSAFLPRAYRRPLREGELARHVGLYESVRKEGGDFTAGLKGTLQAALVSPHFLYRTESQPEPGNPRRVHALDEHALASRLSYFLWSSLPDDELFRAASEGRLTKELDQQISRMLRDGKAEALTRNFAGQWLQLRNLDLAAPDHKTYPNWDGALRAAMKGETEHFFGAVMKEDRSILEFLDSDYTYVNEQLAKHYGIPNIQGSQFQRVSLEGSLRQQRGGVLSHASILTITSGPTRTSAVNRGNWVLENFLAAPPPPPPAELEIPPLEDSGKGENEKKTLRQQLEAHRAQPVCASCHDRMDPIGFGLENYDAIGGWREEEKGQPIDPAGVLYTGEKFGNPAEFRALLAGAKREAFVGAITEAMLTYALGRGLEYYDKPAIKQISHRTAEGGYTFHALVKAVAGSTPFRYRRGEAAPGK